MKAKGSIKRYWPTLVIALTVTGTMSLMGFRQDNLTASELVRWVETSDNDLRQSKTIGAYTYTLQQRPIDYIIALEARKDHIEEAFVEERRAQLAGMEYYMLRIQAEGSNDILASGITSEGEYFTRVSYLDDQFSMDIKQKRNETELPCVLFHHVQNYGLAPYCDFVFAFEKERKGKEDGVVEIEDKVFGGGLLKFKFSKSDLSSVPKLITQ